MKVKNTTDIPNDVVREIISFTKPSGISKFDVIIRNGVQLRGWAHTKPTRRPYKNRHGADAVKLGTFVMMELKDPYIDCILPTKQSHTEKFPRKLLTYQYGQLKGRRYYLASRTEALVYLIAHELRHLWQAKGKARRGYVWGSRGRYSEIDTESYAIKMLRAWRRR